MISHKTLSASLVRNAHSNFNTVSKRMPLRVGLSFSIRYVTSILSASKVDSKLEQAMLAAGPAISR